MTLNTADDDAEGWMNGEEMDETVPLEEDDIGVESDNIEGNEGM